MSETENSTRTKDNNIKKSPGIITPFSPPETLQQQPNETTTGGEVITPLSAKESGTVIELGPVNSPTEYSLKPAPPQETRDTVHHVAKRDMRSKQSIQKEQELRRESLIDSIKEALRANRPGSEIIKDLDVDMSGEAIASLVREAKSRLENERAEEQQVIEDRRIEFQRRLQERRFVCPYCKGTFGWSDESESNHLKVCDQYHQHKKAEEQKVQRRKNFVNRYERLLDFDISRSNSSIVDLIDTINELKWTEQEAKYSTKDDAILEGLQRVKEKFGSEGEYDRQRRQKQIANLRNAATALEALYRRLDEEPEGE
jgi:hypothetical protein